MCPEVEGEEYGKEEGDDWELSEVEQEEENAAILTQHQIKHEGCVWHDKLRNEADTILLLDTVPGTAVPDLSHDRPQRQVLHDNTVNGAQQRADLPEQSNLKEVTMHRSFVDSNVLFTGSGAKEESGEGSEVLPKDIDR